MAQKTTIYLDPDDYRRLKLIARQQRRPTAELVREAVAEYARRHAPPVAPTSIGAARTRRGDLSERAEELLDGLGRDG
jgi:predicted transcriptional regulator